MKPALVAGFVVCKLLLAFAKANGFGARMENFSIYFMFIYM